MNVVKKGYREEYNEIYNEINKNRKFKKLNTSMHHGITRLEHTNRVGYLSFLFSKLFKLDTYTVTRGALLHDFYIEKDLKKLPRKQIHKIHPYIALNNSMKYFDLNEVEKNIITSHMFPFNVEVPKFKESVFVGIADKIVATFEFFKYNSKAYAYFILLFISTK